MRLLSVLVLMMVSFSFGCGGYGSGNGMQPATTPNISGLSPDSANAGSGDFVLTVNGTGFASNSVVYWNSANVSTTYVNAQQITASISAADIATSGAVSVYVKNPGTGIYAMGVNSNVVHFTVN
ncbi:MAG: IPT/TIG domain-containing protein [Terriglobales bacterium]